MGPTGKLIGNQNHGVLAPDLKVSCRCFLPGTKYLTKLETLVEITNLGENWHCSFSFRGSWRFLQSLRLCRAHIYIYIMTCLGTWDTNGYDDMAELSNSSAHLGVLPPPPRPHTGLFHRYKHLLISGFTHYSESIRPWGGIVSL